MVESTSKAPAAKAVPAAKAPEPKVVIKEVQVKVVEHVDNHAELSLEDQAKRRNME